MEKKKNKKSTKKKKLIVIFVIVIIVIFLIKIGVDKSEEKIWDEKEYSSVKDFATIKEVANYLECELIREKVSKEEPYKKDIYMKIKHDLYDGNISNEGFFEKLVALIINVEDYNSFRIIDEEKNIIIGVVCNPENKTHLKTIINDEENYFIKRDSKINIEESKKNDIDSTNINVSSIKLKELINKDWLESKVDFGKKESEFNGYDIYFEEGIELKVVDKKIYNIVFTNKYKESVVNNIKVGEEHSKIIEILGEPTLGEKDVIIGYKTNEFYVFFSNNSISVYRLEEYEKEEVLEVIKKYEENQDLKQLANNLTDVWYDYDNYDYDRNYINLTFSVKGISVEAYDQIRNPIKIYNNFKYIDEISEFTSIEFINEDLVYLQEQNRIYSTTVFPREEELERNFLVMKTEKEESLYNASFISLVADFPNRTLEENINDFIWYDENKFIYSIDYNGIYIVDLRTGESKILIEETEKIDIESLENSILRYNEKELEIK